MVADALGLWVVKLSVYLFNTMQEEWVLVFHDNGFKQFMPTQWQDIKENANIFLFNEINSPW